MNDVRIFMSRNSTLTAYSRHCLLKCNFHAVTVTWGICRWLDTENCTPRPRSKQTNKTITVSKVRVQSIIRACRGTGRGVLHALLSLKKQKEPHSHETQCHAENLYLSVTPARQEGLCLNWPRSMVVLVSDKVWIQIIIRLELQVTSLFL